MRCSPSVPSEIGRASSPVIASIAPVAKMIVPDSSAMMMTSRERLTTENKKSCSERNASGCPMSGRRGARRGPARPGSGWSRRFNGRCGPGRTEAELPSCPSVTNRTSGRETSCHGEWHWCSLSAGGSGVGRQSSACRTGGAAPRLPTTLMGRSSLRLPSGRLRCRSRSPRAAAPRARLVARLRRAACYCGMWRRRLAVWVAIAQRLPSSSHRRAGPVA